MKISIIIPSFNQGQYLEETINSVLNQNSVDLEIIVNDGGSSDNSLDILNKYSKSIKWKSESDYGQTDAINRGIYQSSGDIIAYLNSDDIYYPNILKKVHDYFESNQDCSIIYGNAHHIKGDGSFLEKYPTQIWDYYKLFETCYICQPSVFWLKEIHQKYGYFDERLHYAMDYEFWLRIGKTNRFDYINDEPFAGSRLHAQNKTLSQRVPAHEEILKIVKLYAEESSQTYTWIRNLASLKALKDGYSPSENTLIQGKFVNKYVNYIQSLCYEHSININDRFKDELSTLLKHFPSEIYSK